MSLISRITLVTALLLGIYIVYASAGTKVAQCEGVEFENLEDMVFVGSCKKPPCRLRKNTNVQLRLLLKPTQDAENLINRVYALMLGVPFPFIGTDGTNACDQIYSADGETKLGCPLKAGETYVYKNQIEVFPIYPRVKLVVHWAIQNQNDTDIICFECPARITN